MDLSRPASGLLVGRECLQHDHGHVRFSGKLRTDSCRQESHRRQYFNGIVMGRLSDRIAKRQEKRQASLIAMRQTPMESITKLPSMAERGPTYRKEQKQLYEYGVYDGMEGLMNTSRRHSVDYCDGFADGQRAQAVLEDGTEGHGAQGPWREAMAQRPAPPSPAALAEILKQRRNADRTRQLERQVSDLLNGLT
jgi:hypothetical protein